MAATFSYAQAAKGLPATESPASKPEEQNIDSSAQANEVTETTEKDASAEEEKIVAPSDKEAEPVAAAQQDVSGTSSPSVANSSTTAPKDEDSNTVNGSSESTWDKQSQASGVEKPTEETNEKSDEKKDVPPPKELKAAPLPAVNVWQQRKEAQDARVKAVAASKPASTKTGASKAASAASSTTGEPQQELPKAALKKKGADGAPEGIKRNKADGAKGRDEDVPPVADASMWPTPQVAQGEEKKKAQEKLEKTDKTEKTEKNAGARHGKEKWMPVPYVPSAVFNTPLPTAGARRGGRVARGGREAGRHGPHGAATAAEKSASNQAPQGAAKQTASESNTGRANSFPSKRSNSAEAPAGAPDSRKGADRSRGPKGADDANVGKQVNGDSFPRHAKGFSRNHESAHKGDRTPLSVDPQARNGVTQDRRFENGPKSADFGGFHADRENHHNNHHRERGDSRPERGRGGSHRGRGGHSGHGSQAPFYNPMQHSFVHPKSFGYNKNVNNRVPLRSPSLPNSAMYGVYPFPADINTMYASYQPMPAGPMTAFPYQPYMEPFSLMSMISMQLEYYFSVDNLCKDLFLRKHMDSQGFVALNFIANFKRIKTLTEDYELLRHVSRQLRTVEHYVGEDGVDRLRPREQWGQWVFPIDQRDPSAQSEGPPPSRIESSPAQNHVEGAVNGVSHHHSLPNGTSVSKTSLSSTAPEFSPSKPLTPQNEVANAN